jgi:fatty-acid desaturase
MRMPVWVKHREGEYLCHTCMRTHVHTHTPRDLNANPLIRFQHAFYLIIGPMCAFLLPAMAAKLILNDFLGGLVYAGVVRLVIVHHSTFAINSVAHYLGDHTYDDSR